MRTGETELRDWMIRALDGDGKAYARLLDALLPRLRAFFRRRMAGREDDIEDLLQETLIALHTRRMTYDRARSFTGWLYAIARYKMIDHFRRQGRTVPIEGLEDSLSIASFEDEVGAGLDTEALLATIPDKQARAIRATRIDGLSTAEAAEREGMGESDVKVSTHRGLKALAARVREAIR